MTTPGVLLRAKPAGVTSHDVVAEVRRGLPRGSKVGHAGTLDPFATGLLLVLVGRATRAQRFLADLPKTYRAVARLGWSSDTGDRDGQLAETGRFPERLEIPVGEQLQRPPAYSAVKVGGERAYALARRGEPVETRARPVTVYRADLLWHEGERAAFEIECSAGTYVRTLITELGDAYCEQLERTAIGPFQLADAHPERLLPIGAALSFLPARQLSPAEVDAVRHGRRVPRGDAAAGHLRLMDGEALVAIGELRADELQPVVVFDPRMKVAQLFEIDPGSGPRDVAIGTFDGVHLGHREVIRGAGTVLTFEPHPLAVIHPEATPKLISKPSVKRDLIESLGVSELVMIPFDHGFSEQSAEDFVRDVLIGRLGASRVSVGENFRFGKGARGTVDLLRSHDEFETRVVPLVEVAGETVSSSHIRGLIAAGDVRQAAEFLDGPFLFEGEVVPGDRRGRELGMPTANLVPEDAYVSPGHGVYAAQACVMPSPAHAAEPRASGYPSPAHAAEPRASGHPSPAHAAEPRASGHPSPAHAAEPRASGYPAAVNVGVRPTFDTGRGLLVEAHLIGFEGDLYGQRLRIAFLERMRGEKRFDSVDDLVAQMHRDVVLAAEIANGRS